ncbi:MAG TPA: hypothetical protein VMG60_11665 [Burkholderiaceae bacterium]|nr:hypothetical protein [Burkholderiaceae bacterium]
MQPSKSILDRSFIYVPSAATAVEQTWRRFGWRPLAEEGGAAQSQATSGQHSAGSSSHATIN